MMTDSKNFRSHTSHIRSLVENPGFRTDAAQVQAKALLSQIAEQIPPYEWRYIARTVIKNIAIATLELENISRVDPDEVGSLSPAARKIALIWESMAQLREATTRETALLNAAVNYELAGYQANAMSIARQLGRNEQGVERTSIEMSALFLQRRFLQLLNRSRRLQVKPSGAEGLNLDLIEAMALALFGNAFSNAAQFFLRGDEESFERAVQVFEKAENLFASLNLVLESNLARSIRSLLPIMKMRATWTLLPGFAPSQSKWQRYLKLLARGVSSDIYRARSISELWPSQITALKYGLLNSTSNKIVRMPTSAGKTRIAELAIVHTLVNNPGAKCVYLAPYRALVSELQESFLNLLSELGYRVSTVTGTYESDDFEELLFRETDVLVTTPEKLDLLLRTRPDFMENVRLLVLDEAQIVHDQHRGIKYELLLTRLMRKLPSVRFITLSAVIPQETLEDFAEWFNASTKEDILTSTWRPSIQRYAMFEWMGQTGVIRYAPEEDIPVLKEFVPGVIHQREFEYKNPETSRINRRKFPDGTNKAQIAAELAFKFAQLGPVLVFCSQTNWVEAVARALQERLRLSILTGQGIPLYFEGKEGARSVLLADEWLGDRPITSWLKSGFGVHYRDLPEIIRNAIEIDFRQRKLHVLIATNTLAQGVNLPVKTVIIHSCGRYIEDSWEHLSAREYWNIAGRAGRAGEETEGLIIHIKAKERDERDFQYYLSRRENVEPVKSALYQKLVDLLQDRLSEEALKADLDPEVLALLVEEGPDPISEDALQEILERSLVRVQATRNKLSIEKLRKVFVSISNDLIEEVGDPELRAVYSSTGLCSNSCQIIRNDVAQNEVLIRELFSQAGPKLLEKMIDLLVPVCLRLREMEPKREFSGSYMELLRRWMEGVSIGDLMREFASEAGSSQKLGRFIDDLFRYRLPWGISGYIRIALKVLDIDRTALSDFVKFLPSMVKFGLPDPVACWAMSAGIPLRQTTIKLAATCRREVSTLNYESFLEWLTTLSSERLHYDFGLTSPMLEDVARAVSLSSMNPLLRKFTSLDEFLPREVEVRGIQYENRSTVALRAQPGQRVELRRDYDNLVDRNTIAVYLLNRQIGYIPHDVAQVLAPEMDTGASVYANIGSVDERGYPPKISIHIELA